jgi:hypothetical protein
VIRRSAIAFLLLIALSSNAQEYERVLLPVGQLANIGPWVTSIQFYNGGTSPAFYFPYFRWCVPRPPYNCPPAPRIEPGKSVVPGLPNLPTGNPTPGAFVYFPTDVIDDVAIDARVLHSSRLDPRQGGTFVGGTQLPVVRPDEYASDRIVLMGITVLPPFSQTLRIYEDDNRGNLSFRLRFFTSTEQIGERVVTTSAAPNDLNVPPYGFHHPGGLQIAELLVAYPELYQGWPHGVNLEITPLQPDTRFWAFVSLTNRTTNEVSLVMPE